MVEFIRQKQMPKRMSTTTNLNVITRELTSRQCPQKRGLFFDFTLLMYQRPRISLAICAWLNFDNQKMKSKYE